MVLQARDIGKADIDLPRAIVFRHLQGFNRCHVESPVGPQSRPP